MKLLSVLFGFSYIASIVSQNFFDGSRKLFAIEGPLYVDSASLHPAVLTTVQDRKKSILVPRNRRRFNSLQAQNMLQKLWSIHNDPQNNYQFDELFSQNDDAANRFMDFRPNFATHNDAQQFDQLNQQNDPFDSFVHNFQLDAIVPRERIVKVLTVPIVKTITVNDVPPVSQLDQLNAQIDFIHKMKLLNQQNDQILWLQNQHNPYTQNDRFQTNQFAQFIPQNDQFRMLQNNPQLDQTRSQTPLFQFHQQNPLNFPAFQNNRIAFSTPFEGLNNQQFQGFQTNFQKDQFQNWNGHFQENQIQNFLQNSQQQTNQQQTNQQQDFGLKPNQFNLNDELDSNENEEQSDYEYQ